MSSKKKKKKHLNVFDATDQIINKMGGDARQHRVQGTSVEAACHLKGEDPKGRTKPNELRLRTQCRGGKEAGER